MPGYRTYDNKFSFSEIVGVFCFAIIIFIFASFYQSRKSNVELPVESLVKIYDQEFKNEKYRIFIFEDKFQVIPFENKAEKD